MPTLSFKNIVINNFYYYVTELIKVYGGSKTLLILGLFLAAMTLMKAGAYILYNYGKFVRNDYPLTAAEP